MEEEPMSSDEDEENQVEQGGEEPKVPRIKLDRLEQQALAHPYEPSYHLEYIECLKEAESWDELRKQREMFSQTFPTTERFWGSWIEDEVQLLSQEVTEEKVLFVESLFPRAHADAYCPSLAFPEVNFSLLARGEESFLGAAFGAIQKASCAFNDLRSVFEQLCQAAPDDVAQDFRLAALRLLVAIPHSGISQCFQELSEAEEPSPDLVKSHQQALKLAMETYADHETKISAAVNNFQNALSGGSGDQQPQQNPDNEDEETDPEIQAGEILNSAWAEYKNAVGAEEGENSARAQSIMERWCASVCERNQVGERPWSEYCSWAATHLRGEPEKLMQFLNRAMRSQPASQSVHSQIIRTISECLKEALQSPIAIPLSENGENDNSATATSTAGFVSVLPAVQKATEVLSGHVSRSSSTNCYESPDTFTSLYLQSAHALATLCNTAAFAQPSGSRATEYSHLLAALEGYLEQSFAIIHSELAGSDIGTSFEMSVATLFNEYLGNYARAQEIFEGLVEANPTDTTIWLRYIRSLPISSITKNRENPELQQQYLTQARALFMKSLESTREEPAARQIASAWQEMELTVLCTLPHLAGPTSAFGGIFASLESQLETIRMHELKRARKVAEREAKKAAKKEEQYQDERPPPSFNKRERVGGERREQGGGRAPPQQAGARRGPEQQQRARPVKMAVVAESEDSENAPTKKRKRGESGAAAVVTSTEMSTEKDQPPAAAATSAKPAADVQRPTNEQLTVFVLNLPFDTNDSDLRSFFEDSSVENGPCVVTAVHVVKDKKGKSKGYGYVELSDDKNMEKALGRNQGVLAGRHLNVSRCNRKLAKEAQAERKFGKKPAAKGSDEDATMADTTTEGAEGSNPPPTVAPGQEKFASMLQGKEKKPGGPKARVSFAAPAKPVDKKAVASLVPAAVRKKQMLAQSENKQ